MLQLTNGEQAANGKHQHLYNGDGIARDRPKIYRQVANLISEGWSNRKISRLCRVNGYVVNAIRKREITAIETRKKQLVSLMANVAQLGGERVEQTIGKAGVRDAIIGTGVAVDKMLALLGQNPQVAIQVNLPSDAERAGTRELHAKLDALTKRLSE